VIANLITRERHNVEWRQRLDLETVTDRLTGIANRRGFERRVRRRSSIGRRRGNACS
jgi:GGDEF domain-containing protein